MYYYNTFRITQYSDCIASPFSNLSRHIEADLNSSILHSLKHRA